ncbi:unnamed protein product [Brassica oleracea]
MIPYMLSDHIFANIRAPSKKKFSFRRRSKRYTPQSTQIGDCWGVFVEVCGVSSAWCNV